MMRKYIYILFGLGLLSCGKNNKHPKLASGYFITAEIRVKDLAKIDLAKQELLKLQKETQNETGCYLFVIHHDTKNPERFILWEQFEDEQAFKKHFEYPHTQNYQQQNLMEVVQYFQTDLLK